MRRMPGVLIDAARLSSHYQSCLRSSGSARTSRSSLQNEMHPALIRPSIRRRTYVVTRRRSANNVQWVRHHPVASCRTPYVAISISIIDKTELTGLRSFGSQPVTSPRSQFNMETCKPKLAWLRAFPVFYVCVQCLPISVEI